MLHHGGKIDLIIRDHRNIECKCWFCFRKIQNNSRQTVNISDINGFGEGYFTTSQLNQSSSAVIMSV